MMKFFRKYNKHLLAVFMSLLLVIWLGGSAISEFVRPKPEKSVRGTALGGPITDADVNRSEFESRCLAELRMSWQGWQDAIQPFNPPKNDERLGHIDWILLQREAERNGVAVTPERARASMTAEGLTEDIIRQRAVYNDINPQAYYDAVAHYFSVQNMVDLYASVTMPPESELRRMARDVLETATVVGVAFPAASFADPKQTFSEEELQAQYKAHRDAKRGTGLDFGYYVEPKVKVQYIRIDPGTIKDHLRGSEQMFEREAFMYWQKNGQTSSEFRWTLAEVEEFKKKKLEADSNGLAAVGTDSNGIGSNGVKIPEPGSFYTDFSQARTKALAAVQLDAARAEGERIANRLGQTLREPWYAVAYDSTGHKPAPDSVKTESSYADAIAGLPANLQYSEGVETVMLDPLTTEELADLEGFGQAGFAADEQTFLRPARLAFDVQGLTEAPEEGRRDTSLHLSLWQTFPRQLNGMDGATYLFRVIEVQPGHAPESLDEVVDQVAEDLRLLAGMNKAREAAEAFATDVGTTSLREAWLADEDLKAKVTPDRGGYVEPAPFPRDSSVFGMRKNMIQPLGAVTDEFVETAFRLAAAEDKASLEVVDLPDEAQVIVMRGKSLKPLYEEDYQAQRDRLIQALVRQQRSIVLGQWLNAKNVRERNQFKFAGRS